jgi:hypothetical protein
MTNGDWNSHVYLIGCEEMYFKIGQSNLPKDHLCSMQSGSPFLLTMVECSNPILARYAWYYEKKLHEEVKDKRHRGEWFVLNGEDIKGLVERIKRIGKTKKNKLLDKIIEKENREYKLGKKIYGSHRNSSNMLITCV